MSKKALSYAAYISLISNSEVVVITVLKSDRDSNNALPVTIKVHLEQKEEKLEVTESHQGVQTQPCFAKSNRRDENCM